MATLDRFQEENSLLQQDEHDKEPWLISGHKNNILKFYSKSKVSCTVTAYSDV